MQLQNAWTCIISKITQLAVPSKFKKTEDNINKTKTNKQTKKFKVLVLRNSNG